MSRPSSLCVYCGSSNHAPVAMLEAAFALGRVMGQAHMQLVYGGGRVGLMGRVADGVLVEGGAVVGIIPEALARREVAHQGLTELIVVDSMHERKAIMADRADAFAVLPGGYGTLDEFFEILTWRQLGLHDKPIFLVNEAGYWDSLLAMLTRIVADNFASAGGPALYETVGSWRDLVPTVARHLATVG